MDKDTETAEGLIRMLAWVYSSGSLRGAPDSQTTPRFSVRLADERRRIERWAGKAGVTLRYLHDDDSTSGAEAIPAHDGNLLGRVLLALGAHLGPGREYNDLPVAVTTESANLAREWFVATYLRNRGAKLPNRPKWILIKERRDLEYHAALAQLLEKDLPPQAVLFQDEGLPTMAAPSNPPVGNQGGAPHGKRGLC